MTNTEPEPITIEPTVEVTRPVMLQGWYNLTALHWQYEPSVIQALLPSGFTVDTFDDAAWVGLIPFHMRRIRVPRTPALGPLSTFPETNVRTYIRDENGRRGVWFFSLDVSRILPALVARVTYGLPYCWSSMTMSEQADGDTQIRSYTSRRKWPRGEASSSVTVRVGRELLTSELTELDHFLTARWALGSVFGSRRLWANIHHGAWPLHVAEVLHCDESLLSAAGLPLPTGTPIARWSPGVDVRIAMPRVAGKING